MDFNYSCGIIKFAKCWWSRVAKCD
jgi:hypothetical protein